MNDIVKVLIPAAGIGTRWQPIAKSIPKEMLPILQKPALQYIVEEALAASLHTIMIINRSNKQAICDYFDPAPILDTLLQERHKLETMTSVHRIIKQAHFSYIHQPEPLGLGHALWLARHMIGKEYCAIMLPDDLIFSDQPGIAQLIRIARQEKASVIAVQEVPEAELSNYGVISIKKQITPNLFQVGNLVEKPNPKQAPSNLAVVGRYILSYKVFQALEQLSRYAVDELQLTDAIACMLQNNERVFAYKMQGTRFDIGTPAGWLNANIYCGLKNPSIAASLHHFCAERELLNTTTSEEKTKPPHL